MTRFVDRFQDEEDGAVTVDWVVLTAGVVGFGIAAVGMLADGSQSVGDTVASRLSTLKLGVD